MQLATNGGLLTVNHCADLPDYGEVWFSENSMTNLFSMAEVSDKVPITFNNKVEDVYIVKFPVKTVKFKRTTNNLYVLTPKVQVMVILSLQECTCRRKLEYRC